MAVTAQGVLEPINILAEIPVPQPPVPVVWIEHPYIPVHIDVEASYKNFHQSLNMV